jgi:hypothetical protein
MRAKLQDQQGWRACHHNRCYSLPDLRRRDDVEAYDRQNLFSPKFREKRLPSPYPSLIKRLLSDDYHPGASVRYAKSKHEDYLSEAEVEITCGISERVGQASGSEFHLVYLQSPITTTKKKIQR